MGVGGCVDVMAVTSLTFASTSFATASLFFWASFMRLSAALTAFVCFGLTITYCSLNGSRVIRRRSFFPALSKVGVALIVSIAYSPIQTESRIVILLRYLQTIPKLQMSAQLSWEQMSSTALDDSRSNGAGSTALPATSTRVGSAATSFVWHQLGSSRSRLERSVPIVALRSLKPRQPRMRRNRLTGGDGAER